MNSATQEALAQQGDTNPFREGRRYVTLPMPSGVPIRLRSLKPSEIKPKLKATPKEHHIDCYICMAVVDEKGDTKWPCSMESFIWLNEELDFQDYEALVDAVSAFCMNTINYEDVLKNLEATRNDKS